MINFFLSLIKFLEGIVPLCGTNDATILDYLPWVSKPGWTLLACFSTCARRISQIHSSMIPDNLSTPRITGHFLFPLTFSNRGRKALGFELRPVIKSNVNYPNLN